MARISLIQLGSLKGAFLARLVFYNVLQNAYV